MLQTMRAFDTLEVTVTTQAAAGVAGPLNASKVMLFTNSPSLSKTSVVGDLVEANYTGYARQTPVWSAPRLDNNNRVATFSGLLVFQPTDAVVPNTIHGYAIVDSTGATLLAAEVFDTPIGLPNALTFLGLILEFSTDNSKPGSATIIT